MNKSVIFFFCIILSVSSWGRDIYSIDRNGEVYIKSGSAKCTGYRTGIFVTPGQDEILWHSIKENFEFKSDCQLKDVSWEPYKLCKKPDGSFQDWTFFRYPTDSYLSRYSIIGIDIEIIDDIYIRNSSLCGKGIISGDVRIDTVNVRYPLAESIGAIGENLTIRGPTFILGDPTPEWRQLRIHNTEFLGYTEITTPEFHVYPDGIFEIIEVKAEDDFELKAGQAPMSVGFYTFKGKVTLNNESSPTKIHIDDKELLRARKDLVERLKTFDWIKTEDVDAYIELIETDSNVPLNIISLRSYDKDTTAHKEIELKNETVNGLSVFTEVGFPGKLQLNGGGPIIDTEFNGDIKVRCKYFGFTNGVVLNGNLVIGDDYDSPLPPKPCKSVEINESTVSLPVRIHGVDVSVIRSTVEGKVILKGNVQIRDSQIGDAGNTSDDGVLIDTSHGYMSNINNSMIFPPNIFKGWMRIGTNLGEEDDRIVFQDNTFEGAFQLDSLMLHSTISTELPTNPEQAPTDMVAIGVGVTIGTDSKFETRANIIGSNIQIGEISEITNVDIGADVTIGNSVSITKANLTNATIGDNAVIDGGSHTVHVNQGTIGPGSHAKGSISISTSGKIYLGAKLNSTTGLSEIFNNGALAGADVTGGRLILNGVSFSTPGFHQKSCYVNSENQYQCDEL